ncbi:uncharacterized protein LOC129971253 [Argiope bruennichi]|uniref:Uncharacterized protein n=1 Tax=Argiope bruennichi TaxID=94029 RepID=A0A8T0F778_ARGBR|nr:uncharacterized protein LOC129971253 [Argiope bruennichi]KAF8786095.1 hypothetical protein HNY73_007859 [Argiope bruennichi]
MEYFLVPEIPESELPHESGPPVTSASFRCRKFTSEHRHAFNDSAGGLKKMASYRLVAMVTENYLLTWPQTSYSRPSLLMSTWTATVATVLLMMTFFAQVTAVVVMTDPTLNVRGLVWSSGLRSIEPVGRRSS